MTRRATLVALMIAVTGGACSGSDTTISPPNPQTTAVLGPTSTTSTSTIPTTSTTELVVSEAPSGFQEFGGAEVGFTMWVPEGWVTLGGEDFDPEAIAEALGDSFDPDTFQMVESAFAGGGLLFSLNPVSVDEFHNNINVIQSPPSGLTAQDLVDPTVSYFEDNLGATQVEAAVVEVAAGEAVRVSYLFPQIGNEGVIYQVVTEDATWIVTFSAGDINAIGFDISELIDSFQPIP